MAKRKSKKKRIIPKRRVTERRKAAKKTATNMPKNRVPKKKTSTKKRSAKTRANTKSSTRSSGRKQRASELGKSPEVSFKFRGPRSQRSSQSGDSQGLSRRPGADSESVEELIEEGNAFEADVVSGVEDAGEHEEEEVHTHEVPEDDVPGEYLNEE